MNKSLADLVKEKIEKTKEPKEVKIEKLHKPPMAPKPIDEVDIEFDEENKITFEEIANSSEFKRLVYLIQFGKTHRGKSRDLERQLIKRRQEITLIKEYGRGTKQDFEEVVKELELKLAKQKEKIENGTN